MGLFDRLRRAFSGEPEEEPKKEDEIVSTSEENQEPEETATNEATTATPEDDQLKVAETTTAEAKEASAEATLAELQTAIEGLKKDLAAKDAEIADLKSKLDNTKVVQNDFQSRLAKMLNFATSTEPTVEEGKDVTPAKKEEEEGDVVLKAYSSAFKDLN